MPAGSSARVYKQGDTIDGQYRVIDVFGGRGKSGMGVVYLVENREIPEPVVLKTYQQQLGETAKQQFLREAAAWVNAGAHPSIVQAYWVREIADQVFVCAEYIAPDELGRNSLTGYLSPRPMALELVVTWGVHFCYGMDYALSKGITAHRDIKPDNLMIDRQGVLKITDFGIAKAEWEFTLPSNQFNNWSDQSGEVSAALTRTGTMKGTLPYIAPEQIVSAKDVDHRADIYSFGIVLYQMISGNQYVYAIDRKVATSPQVYLDAHLNGQPEVGESRLSSIVMRCLEKKPDDRYGSYDELLSDLREVAKQKRILLPVPRQASREDEELYAKAQSYVALGDSAKALEVINEYVAKYSENSCGWTEKGRIHLQRGENDNAIKATRKSLSLAPYNTYAWNNLGIALKRSDDFSGSIEAFRSALEFDPENVVAMANMIGSLISTDAFDEAVDVAITALRLAPMKESVTYNSGSLLTLLMERGLMSNAKKLQAARVEVRPDDVDAWHNLGLIHLDARTFKDAAECFEKVLELEPSDTFAVEQLAKLYFELKKAPECIKYCNRLLDLGHRAQLAIQLKARVINYTGGYERVLQYISPILENNMESYWLYLVRAEAHEYRDNFSAARQDYMRAKHLMDDLDPRNVGQDLKYVERKLDELLDT